MSTLRGLFVAINKRAVPVNKRDIVALDEVDLAAIITRHLVDNHPWFSRGQVDVDRFTSAVPAGSKALTTIAGLYGGTVTAAGRSYQLSMPQAARDSFLDGSWDATGLLLEDFGQVRAVAARLPYVAANGF